MQRLPQMKNIHILAATDETGKYFSHNALRVKSHKVLF